MPSRIAVFGAGGKVGKAIVRAVAQAKDARLVAAVERADYPYLGADAAQLAGLPAAGVRLVAERPGPGEADAWIDFSLPAATLANLAAAQAAGAAMVIGTTGLSAADKETIAAAAKRIPIVFSPNMSVGVNVLLKLVADAARTLGPGYDIEIVETHHRAKRDAPSGTALRLGEAAAEGAGRDFAASARYARQGEIGPRTDVEIGMQTLRGGDVVGDHTVFFLGQGDRIELTHRASSRDTFGHGAVRAALWLAGKERGLFDMRDVLGLK
jgi:4-hydroxy-tetrahydrodipicolinate reductase